MQVQTISTHTAIFPDEGSLYPHQLEALYDTTRFKVLCWHRRSRKTSTGLTKLILEAIRPDVKPSTYFFVMPSYAEAKLVCWTEPDMLFSPRLLGGALKQQIEKINETELTVYFKNGSILSLKGSDNFERLLGSNPRGVVLDEAAMQKEEIWSRVVYPIIKVNRGFVWFSSTPRGRNWFHRLYLHGTDSKNKGWKSYFLSADTSGILTPEELEQASSEMPERFFKQEFFCAFLEGASTFFRGVKDVATAQVKRPQPGKSYVVGIDLGKSVDYTALTIFDTQTNEMVWCSRFKSLEWPYVKEKIIKTARFYNDAAIVLDSTGLGSPILDDLQRMTWTDQPDPYQNDLIQEGLSVIGITLSAPRKKELVEKLAIYIEQQRVRLLDDPDLVGELEAFGYELLPSGRVRYGAPQGLHDDFVISTALAVSYLFPVVPLEVEKPKTPVRLYFEKLLKRRAYREGELQIDPFDENMAEEMQGGGQ